MKRLTYLAVGMLALSMSLVPAAAIVPIGPRPPGPAPAGWVYRYVPPVYRTIADRVWISERVEWVSEWAWVNGQYQQVYRQVVRPGHYETTTRQVLVAAGYWQLVRLDPPPRPMPMPRPYPVVVNPGTVGVEGYRSGPGEDLSPFSGLSEWPK